MADAIYLMTTAFIFGMFFGGYIRPRLSKYLSSKAFNNPVDLTPIFANKDT